MALPANTLSYIGSINNDTANPSELQLKVWSGEVLTAFMRSFVLSDKHMVKRITTGKSAQFPGMGRASATFFARGTNLITDAAGGTAFNNTEAIVHVDRPSIAFTFVDEADDLLNHWETQSRINTELGEALAEQREDLAYRQLTRAARARVATAPDYIPTDLGDALGGGGGVQVAGGASFSASQLLTAMISAAQIMDEKSVPRDGQRWAPLLPAAYWLILQNTDLLNRDFGNEGNGVYAEGEISVAAGLNLLMSTQIPQDNLAATPTGANNNYASNCTELVTVAFHPDAIGSVFRVDPKMEGVYKTELQATFLLAKLLAGTNVLRPASAVEIYWGAAQPAFT